jgi:hypothetical protein
VLSEMRFDSPTDASLFAGELIWCSITRASAFRAANAHDPRDANAVSQPGSISRGVNIDPPKFNGRFSDS